MKKTLLLIALSFASMGMVTTSCGSDRDDEEVSAPARYNVTGNWKMDQYKNEQGAWSSMAILNYYINLNSDKTFKTNYLGTVATGTYTYDQKDLIITTSSYGTDYIKVSSMSATAAEVVMYDPNDPSDKIEFRLVK